MQYRSYTETVMNVLETWYQKFMVMTPNLIVGVIIFIIFYMASTYLSKFTVKVFNKVSPKTAHQDTVLNLIGFFRFIFILIGTFLAFEVMGFSGFVLKFIGSLGVAGVIAGVALKDLVSSIFSGMLVSVDKAFKVGDYITISNVTGTVEEIGFLTTKVITDEGKKVYVPNQLIFNAPFVNFSASKERKIFVNLEIPNTENLEKAKKAVLDTINSLESADPAGNAEVVFQKQSLGIFYLEGRFQMVSGGNIAQAKSEALLKIKEKLDAEGISMVPPTMPATEYPAV